MYYTYIVASRSRTLYTGVTNNITRRVSEHREGVIAGFTKRYRVHRLVWYEPTRDVRRAIAREKEIKGWSRAKKEALIRGDIEGIHEIVKSERKQREQNKKKPSR